MNIQPSWVSKIHHIPTDILVRRLALDRINAQKRPGLRGIPSGAEEEEVNVTPIPFARVTIRAGKVGGRFTASNITQVSVVTNVSQLLTKIGQGSKRVPLSQKVIGWGG